MASLVRRPKTIPISQSRSPLAVIALVALTSMGCTAREWATAEKPSFSIDRDRVHRTGRQDERESSARPVKVAVTLIPLMHEDRVLTALVSKRTAADIDRLQLVPYRQDSIGSFAPISQLTGLAVEPGDPQSLVLTMERPVAFNRQIRLEGLRPRTRYRILAKAFDNSGALISTTDSRSFVEVTVDTDDRPEIPLKLPVKLIDSPFEGRSTVNLSVDGPLEEVRDVWLALFLLENGLEVELPAASLSVGRFELPRSIVLANLKPFTTYRLRGRVRDLDGWPAGSNFVDLPIAGDEEPASHSLAVKATVIAFPKGISFGPSREPDAVRRVDLQSEAGELNPGDTTRLNAVGRTSDGREVRTTWTWSQTGSGALPPWSPLDPFRGSLWVLGGASAQFSADLGYAAPGTVYLTAKSSNDTIGHLSIAIRNAPPTLGITDVNPVIKSDRASDSVTVIRDIQTDFKLLFNDPNGVVSPPSQGTTFTFIPSLPTTVTGGGVTRVEPDWVWTQTLIFTKPATGAIVFKISDGDTIERRMRWSVIVP